MGDTERYRVCNRLLCLVPTEAGKTTVERRESGLQVGLEVWGGIDKGGGNEGLSFV